MAMSGPGKSSHHDDDEFAPSVFSESGVSMNFACEPALAIREDCLPFAAHKNTFPR